MTAAVLLWILGVVLPNPGDIPVLEAGASINVSSADGGAWFRILERDYALLDLRVTPTCRLTAYNDAGEVVATSEDGSLVLSAYSDYWFWVLAEGRGALRAELTRRLPAPATPPFSGRLPQGVMAEAVTLNPPSAGRYQIILTGNGSADLDLEVYGPGNRLWASSYSGDGDEKVILDLQAGEPVTVLVTRYNKSGSGDFLLEMDRVGDFRVLDGLVEMESRPDRIERFLIPGRSRASLLQLAYQGDDDLDLMVRDSSGDVVWSSTTYSFSEMVMIPRGVGTLVAEVVNYPGEDGENPWFALSLTPPDTVLAGSGGSLAVHASGGLAPLVGYCPGSEGFHVVSALFDKTRDGDLRLFRRPGEASVLMATMRGDEEFMIWIGPRDTVWVAPGFSGMDREGGCLLGFTPGGGDRLQGRAAGSVDTDREMVRFYTVQGDPGGILLVKLTGEPDEMDLDMLVSGPGFDLQAEGAQSNTDSASDEAVATYVENRAQYAVTVYAYERRASGTFEISAESIPVVALAPGTPGRETWAVIAGISGYSDLVDILSRCSMDAMDVREFLMEQGVSPDHMVVLVDQNATLDSFDGALDRVLQRAGPEDRLVVFYSGHGSREAPGSGGPEEEDAMNEVLCFYDGDMDDDLLARRLRGFQGFSMVFLDACHSGGFVNDFRDGDNVLVLTAAREDLSVSERILTPILLQGSRGGADSDNDGLITAGELADYVDMTLQRVCPFCDTILEDGSSRLCPGCGEILKGENRIPRPEQGVFTDPGTVVWTVSE